MGASLSAASSQGQQQPTETSLHPSSTFGGQNVLPSGFVSPASSEQLSKEKKRKSTTLSTLRRRLIRKRRTSKSFDHAQVFRAFLSFWNKKDVVSLVEEYDATSVLKDLVIQADIARLESNTCRQDLGELFECKYFSDINLIYQGVTFPVHRALLAARCPFFRELLNDISLSCNEVMVDIDIAGMSVQMFNDLLKYLYTGELSVTEKSEGSLNILYQLSEQFGIPNPLEQDLKFLLEMGMYCDARLVFSSGVKRHHFPSNALRPNSTDLYIGCYSGGDFEIPCHIAVLSARSPFFRNVIRRHFERQADLRVHDFVPARIVLDESIIPRRFAKIVVQALYQDVPDFSSLLHHLNRVSSVNDLPLSSSGIIQKDPTEETMQLYEIAKFLEMDSLAQSCEDTIVESLTLETVIPILKWSSQPHGSQWVRRQALSFIREEFMSVSSSITLLQLEKSDLVEIVQSDFLQASELEVLQAVLKWGEHQLMRRIEEREPNLVSQTAHSVSRRGLKRRDLCDMELREILADVICHVRINHILPQDSEILVGSIKRGLIPSPPPHMLSDEVGVGPRCKIAYWVRGSAKGGPFVRPRLFTPYIEEAKSWLEEEFGQEAEVTHRQVWQISHIPDTLYMVDKPFLDDEHWQAPSNLDIVKGMVLDDHTMKLLRNREDELRKTVLVQKAYSIVRNPYEVTRLLLLRVVRDFGLPDITADILQQRPSSYASGVSEEVPEIHLPMEAAAKSASGGCRSGICGPSNSGGGLAGAIGGPSTAINYSKASAAECRRPNSSSSSSQQIHRRFCSEHQLSGIIPDIAMATSLMGRMQLLDGESAAEPNTTAAEKRETKSSRLAMSRSAMKQNRDSCR